MGGGAAAQQALTLSCSLTNSGLCPDLPPLLTEQTFFAVRHTRCRKESESAADPMFRVDDTPLRWFNYEGWGGWAEKVAFSPRHSKLQSTLFQGPIADCASAYETQILPWEPMTHLHLSAGGLYWLENVYPSYKTSQQT